MVRPIWALHRPVRPFSIPPPLDLQGEVVFFVPPVLNDASGICNTCSIILFLWFNGDDSLISSEQMRAARALLKWDQKTLATASKVSIATIKRLEPLSGPVQANEVTIEAIRRALQKAGIEFIEENGGGAGVRFAKRRTAP